MSYKVGCKTRPTEPWTYNALRFGTAEEAEAYGADLYARWLALEAYEVHASDEPATYTMQAVGQRPIPLRLRIESDAKNIHAAIDAAWHREHREHRDQEPTCPECSGTGSQLSEDGTQCFACTAADYQEGDL